MAKLVNKKELSILLDKAESTITTWQRNGMPVHSLGEGGQGNRYEVHKVMEWVTRRELAKLTKTEDGNTYDLEAERARLAHHQANKTSLEEATIRGELIPGSTVTRVWGKMLSAFRSKVFAIPSKAAHEMVGLEDLNEIQEIFKSHLYEAFKELREYDPRDYDIRDNQELSVAPVAASNANSK